MADDNTAPQPPADAPSAMPAWVQNAVRRNMLLSPVYLPVEVQEQIARDHAETDRRDRPEQLRLPFIETPVTGPQRQGIDPDTPADRLVTVRQSELDDLRRRAGGQP